MAEVITLAIDITLLAMGVVAMRSALQVGGSIGFKSLKIMAVGFLVLGFAHITETALVWFMPTLEIEILELSHRVLVLIGFTMILYAYLRLARFVRS